MEPWRIVVMDGATGINVAMAMDGAMAIGGAVAMDAAMAIDGAMGEAVPTTQQSIETMDGVAPILSSSPMS